MELENQKRLYSILFNLLKRYDESLGLDRIKKEYSDIGMHISGLIYYLCKQYSQYGITEPIASDMYNEFVGEFISPKGYSFINTKSDPELARRVEELNTRRRVYNNATRSYITNLFNGFGIVETMKKGLLNNYSNKEIIEKIDKFLSKKAFVEFLKGSDVLLYSLERRNYGYKNYGELDCNFLDLAHEYRQIINLYILNTYKKYANLGESHSFFQIFDNAYVDERQVNPSQIEERLNNAYKFYRFPTRNHRFVKFSPHTSTTTNSRQTSSSKKSTNTTTGTQTTKTISSPTINSVNTITKSNTSSYSNSNVVNNDENVIRGNSINVLKYSTVIIDGNFYKLEKVNKEAVNIFLDDAITSIYKRAFKDCKNLKEVTLNKNLSVIDSGVFSNLENLSKVNFVEGLKTIKSKAFYNSGLVGQIILPQSLKKIDELAFYVKNPKDLELWVYKKTRWDVNAINPNIKICCYDSLNDIKKQNTVSIKQTINTSPIPKVVSNNSETNNKYEEGKKIYNKYSGKAKMLEAAKLMEPKAIEGDLEACELVVRAYCKAEKYQKSEQYIQPLITNKRIETILWYADSINIVRGYAPRSKDLFLFAAENGFPDAYKEVSTFYYGFLAYSVKDYKKSMEYLLLGAEKGSEVCMMEIALTYLSGLGNVVKPNKAKYISYLKLAADNGSSAAQWRIGCYYFKGTYGFPVNKQLANHWFNKAAYNSKKPNADAKLVLQGDYSKII